MKYQHVDVCLGEGACLWSDLVPNVAKNFRFGEMLELTTPGDVGSHLARPGYGGATPFGDTQLKVHLARLADYELVIAHRTASGGFCYELAWHPPRPAGMARMALRHLAGRCQGAPGRGWSAPGRPAPVTVNGQASGHMWALDHAEGADPGRANHQVIAAAGGAR